MIPRGNLLRLTVDHRTGNVTLNTPGDKNLGVFGRSAYLCAKASCLSKAQKGGRLHKALEGRRRMKLAKNAKNAPVAKLCWPLEPQLIKVIGELCTEDGKTCQNTVY
jgi:predicted RNA-binding protein YlxR (DUF448 family)